MCQRSKGSRQITSLALHPTYHKPLSTLPTPIRWKKKVNQKSKGKYKYERSQAQHLWKTLPHNYAIVCYHVAGSCAVQLPLQLFVLYLCTKHTNTKYINYVLFKLNMKYWAIMKVKMFCKCVHYATIANPWMRCQQLYCIYYGFITFMEGQWWQNLQMKRVPQLAVTLLLKYFSHKFGS